MPSCSADGKRPCRRGQKKTRQVIGEHPVLLFRLLTVQRTQPRLHVHHRDLDLAGGKGGVGAATKQHCIRQLIKRYPLDLFHYPDSVGSKAAATNAQMERWFGDAQLYKELIRYHPNEMVTGVQNLHQNRYLAAMGGGDGTAHGSCLEDLGAGGHDREVLPGGQARTMW